MGSYNMAFNKILFVLVAAGGSSAWAQSSLFGFSNNFNNAPATPSTTPVPNLRYVDNQNIDGSYTYGYEAADGTYKIETRYVDGRVKGKQRIILLLILTHHQPPSLPHCRLLLPPCLDIVNCWQ